MQVTVRFLDVMRDRAGKRSMVIELPDGATYRDLLDHIAPEMESGPADWAWDAERGSFSRRMMVLRNSSVELRDGSTGLEDGDEIVVLVPLAGG